MKTLKAQTKISFRWIYVLMCFLLTNIYIEISAVPSSELVLWVWRWWWCCCSCVGLFVVIFNIIVVRPNTITLKEWRLLNCHFLFIRLSGARLVVTYIPPWCRAVMWCNVTNHYPYRYQVSNVYPSTEWTFLAFAYERT